MQLSRCVAGKAMNKGHYTFNSDPTCGWEGSIALGIEVCDLCYGSGEIRTHFKDWICGNGIIFHIENVMNCPKCDSKGYVKSLRISRV